MNLRLFLLLALLLTRSIRATPEADRLVYEGIDAYKAKNYDLAISKFTESIKSDPKNVSAYNNRGLAHREKKEYDEAIADFTVAARIKPDWFVFYNRGTAYYETRDANSAITDFTMALKLNPKDTQGRVRCLIGRARADFEKEKIAEAMVDLNTAIKLGVKEPQTYVLRGILHKINHDYERSLADYEKAISMDPNDARSYEVEAHLLSTCPMSRFRDGKKAITYATKACELTQWKDADYIQTLAAAYAEAGQFDEAIEFETKSVQTDPKRADEKRLALYQQHQPFRELSKGEQTDTLVANIKDKLTIKPGQKLLARFEVKENKLVGPNIAKIDGKFPEPDQSPNSVWLDFRQDKRGPVLFLWHSCGGTVQASCLTRSKGNDIYVETTFRPVPVKVISPTAWRDPVEEVVLFDFKLTDTRKH